MSYLKKLQPNKHSRNSSVFLSLFMAGRKAERLIPEAHKDPKQKPVGQLHKSPKKPKSQSTAEVGNA